MEDTPRAYNPWLVAVVVSLVTFMEVLDTTITNVALSHMAGTFGASQNESTWVLTSYLVANGIILPLSGWLAGALGRKRFFMICIASFTAASFACGLSTSLAMLIVFRLLQGLSGGGLQPIQQAIILDAFPPEKRGAVFGVTGITMIVAPILGPTLGGYITDNFSWQWIFYMNVPIGALAFFLVGRMVQDPPHARAQGFVSIDYIGLALVAIGLGTLQVVLDKGQTEDWFSSNFIITFSCISFACLSTATIWLLNQENPIIDLHLFSFRSYGFSWIMMFFVGASLYGCSTLMPILVQYEYGYDSTLAGLVLSPGGVLVVFIIPLVSILVGYVPARYLIALGMALCSAGMFATMFNIAPDTSYYWFALSRIAQVSGLPFLFISVSTLAFIDIPKEKSSKASALFSMSRNLGGSVGIALITSYIVRQEQVHQSYLAGNLSPANPGYQTLLGSYLHSGLGSVSDAMKRIYADLLHQSDILAFTDAFELMGAVMALFAAIALLMPRNDPHKKGVEAVAH